METPSLEQLRHPIGRYQAPAQISPEQISQWIDEIEAFPPQLAAAVANLTDAQLDTPYRPEGWTLRQVVHHLVDSHLNSYIRFKWSLTEAGPTIKAYDEGLWAALPEAKTAPVAVSLELLRALHKRWTLMLRNMSAADWQRKYYHPEQQKWVLLNHNLGLYAWHGQHHLAHINELKVRRSW